jgi:hypothetical protein
MLFGVISQMSGMKKLLYISAICMVAACDPLDSAPLPGESDAYVPVYASMQDVHSIAVEPAKAVEQAGKIYVYGNYIFQNDQYKGIHIIDNSVRTAPRKIAFIRIPLSTEVAVKGGHLYTNNHNDLVVFDLANITSPQLVKRMENVFPMVNQQYPPFSNIFFECVDPSKGVVVRWELKRIKTPACKR